MIVYEVMYYATGRETPQSWGHFVCEEQARNAQRNLERLKDVKETFIKQRETTIKKFITGD